jgi:hypothetical protein
MNSNRKEELQSKSNQKNQVFNELMLARIYAAKAAAHAQKVSETYSFIETGLSNKIASSCFDLTISLINSMKLSTDISDLFDIEMEIDDEKLQK